MLARVFALVLLVALPSLAAAAPAAPAYLPAELPRYVEAELVVAQPGLARVGITGELWAYRHDVAGAVYDADDMGAAYSGANKHGAATGEAFAAAFEREVAAALDALLAASFPGDTVAAVSATVDRASFRTDGGSPYDPPVRVTVSGEVSRGGAVGSLSASAIEAAFDAGARYQLDLAFLAPPGYSIAYVVEAPPGLRWERASGVEPDGSALRVTVDNVHGGGTSLATSARLYDPDAAPPREEDVRTRIEATFGAVARDAEGIPLELSVASDVHALDLARRFPHALPPAFDLPFVNADGLRALYASGVLTPADLARIDAALLADLEEDLARAFGPGSPPTGGVVAEELARPPATPFSAERPLRLAATATTTYVVPGIENADVAVALRVGGTVGVPMTLFAANGRETLFTFRPPSGAEFVQVDGGGVAEAGQRADVWVAEGERAHPTTFSLRGRDAPSFTMQDARIDVLVDITDVDTGVGNALSGELGSMVIDIHVRGRLNVIELPADVRASLPPHLELRYVSSDAVRLLVESGQVSLAQLARIEDELAAQVRVKLAAALGASVEVESGLDHASLSPYLVSTPISSDVPILFEASARVTKPLSEGPPQPQAAIALYTQQMPLALPRIQGLDTVYTVIAPRGLAITAVEGDGIELGTAPDGRDQFTARPSEGGSSQVMVSMAVTPMFVLAKFWPLVLLAVLLLILVVGTPVALVVMRRRKAKAPAPPADE